MPALTQSDLTQSQLDRLFGSDDTPTTPPAPGQPTYGTTYDPRGTDVPEWAASIAGGMRETAANALTNLGQLTGWQWPGAAAQTPTMAIDPATQAAMQEHPWLETLGNIGTITGLTLPLTLGGEATLPALAEAAAARFAPGALTAARAAAQATPGVAKYMARSGLSGMLGNELTGDPNMSPEDRAKWGGIVGALTGLPFGWAQSLSGATRTLPGNLAAQAQAVARLRRGTQPGTPAAAVSWLRNQNVPGNPYYTPPAGAPVNLGQVLRNHLIDIGLGGGDIASAVGGFLASGGDPSAAINPLSIGTTAAMMVKQGYRAGNWLGQQWQNRTPYIWNLIQRKGLPSAMPITPYTTGPASTKVFPPSPPY